MRVVLTGATGLLGCALLPRLRERHSVVPLSRKDLDVTFENDVSATLKYLCPEVVLHAAGIADPDKCELNPEMAYRVNVSGTQNLVRACKKFSMTLALISTDAVFSGRRRKPYLETDDLEPYNVYGMSKAESEFLVRTVEKHFVFRPSVLFGPGENDPVKRCLLTLRDGREFAAAADQLATATYTVDAARTIADVIEGGPCGIYHVCNSGECSRLDLANAIAEIAGFPLGFVRPTKRAEFGRPAPRVEYAVMEPAALPLQGYARPRHWKLALAEHVHYLMQP